MFHGLRAAKRWLRRAKKEEGKGKERKGKERKGKERKGKERRESEDLHDVWLERGRRGFACTQRYIYYLQTPNDSLILLHLEPEGTHYKF